MRSHLLLALSLFVTIQAPTFGQQITVKPGDTLSGIASKYSISVRSLMDKNEIFNADNLKVGQQLKLPDNASLALSTTNNYHTVKAGENISSIANYYGIEKRTILDLNNFNNPNFLFIGQRVILPNEVKKSSSNRKPTKSKHHIVNKGETLTMISRKYKIPLNDLIEINNLDNPSTIRPGLRLSLNKGLVEENDLKSLGVNSNIAKRLPNKKSLNLAQAASADWRKYGSLKINWANWKKMDGSHVTPAVNLEGKPLFLAVNCETTRMNHTGENNKWKKWFAPSLEFEFNLLDDICKTNL